MELDKRIKEGKRPLTCFDLKEASGFLEKTGYFSNELDYFSDLSETGCFSEVRFGRLLGIKDNKRCAFKYLSMDGSYENSYRFFLPEDWVLPKEKKYRPYSLEEFLEIFGIGDQIVFRVKNADDIKCAMFTGYITDVERIDDKTPGACEVMLGCFHYSLLSLFEECERFYNGRWWPFGVLDKENE